MADRSSTTLGTTCPLQSFALSWSLFRSESLFLSAVLLCGEPLLDRLSCNCSHPHLHHPHIHQLPKTSVGHDAMEGDELSPKTVLSKNFVTPKSAAARYGQR